jgi:hypothetical protein
MTSKSDNICRAFLRNSCRRGDACRFSHEVDEDEDAEDDADEGDDEENYNDGDDGDDDEGDDEYNDDEGDEEYDEDGDQEDEDEDIKPRPTASNRKVSVENSVDKIEDLDEVAKKKAELAKKLADLKAELMEKRKGNKLSAIASPPPSDIVATTPKRSILSRLGNVGTDNLFLSPDNKGDADEGSGDDDDDDELIGEKLIPASSVASSLPMVKGAKKLQALLASKRVAKSVDVQDSKESHEAVDMTNIRKPKRDQSVAIRMIGNALGGQEERLIRKTILKTGSTSTPEAQKVSPLKKPSVSITQTSSSRTKPAFHSVMRFVASSSFEPYVPFDQHPSYVPYRLSSEPDQDGLCMTMCPTKETPEVAQKHEEAILKRLENGGRDRIKLFERSAAGEIFTMKDTRPPPVLLKTLDHIETHILPKLNDDRWPTVQCYIKTFDWYRQIVAEFTLQQYTGSYRVDSLAIECFERMARFYISIEHRMRGFQEYRSTHAKQNHDRLAHVFKILVDMLRQFNFKSQNTAEFFCYYVIDTNDLSHLQRVPGIHKI